MEWRRLGIPHPASFQILAAQGWLSAVVETGDPRSTGAASPAKPDLCFRNMTFWFPDCCSLASCLCALQL